MKGRFFKILLVLLFCQFCMLAQFDNINAASKNNNEAVTFYVHLHCQDCVNKIMNNIAFEKGVKDIQCDLDKKTVLVTYLPNKTDIPTLQQAFKKINKPAFLSMEEYNLYYKQH